MREPMLGGVGWSGRSITLPEPNKHQREYRAAARDILDACMASEWKVGDHASIQRCTSGAFVEALIWVSDEMVTGEV